MVFQSTYLTIFFLALSNILIAQQKPNIIHIVGDDVGWDDLSSFGSTYYKTPNIDKLASECVRLTNFYAPHSTCTPSRAAFMTGRYSPRINDGNPLGVLFPSDTRGLDSAKEITFTKILQQNNYKTALFGKWHLGHLPQFLPLAHGFDVFLGIPYPNDHGPERQGNTGSRGFPPIPLIENNVKIHDLDNNDLAELPAKFVRGVCDFISSCVRADQQFYVQYSNIETHTPYFIPKGFGGSQYGAYGDAVEYFDLSVGIIIDHIKKLGIEKNTIIVLHADNGPLVYRYEELERCYGRYAYVDTSLKHLLRDGKYQDRFEGGQRVSCIIKWPGVIPSGKVNQQIITGADWFTTFITLAGGSVPKDRIIDGKYVLPILTNVNAPAIRNTYYAFDPYSTIKGVRYNDWKLVIDKRNAPTKYLLYDLANDPGEKTDLSASYVNIVTSLKLLVEEATHAVKNKKPLKDFNQFNF